VTQSSVNPFSASFAFYCRPGYEPRLLPDGREVCAPVRRR
jgi:hypothetical protein